LSFILCAFALKFQCSDAVKHDDHFVGKTAKATAARTQTKAAT
jgi:hypothetical protein